MKYMRRTSLYGGRLSVLHRWFACCRLNCNAIQWRSLGFGFNHKCHWSVIDKSHVLLTIENIRDGSCRRLDVRNSLLSTNTCITHHHFPKNTIFHSFALIRLSNRAQEFTIEFSGWFTFHGKFVVRLIFLG